MTQISRNATFSPSDALEHILRDLSCPACGHQDPQFAGGAITKNRIHLFCDACGAFVTIVLDDDQARAITRWAAAHTAARAVR